MQHSTRSAALWLTHTCQLQYCTPSLHSRRLYFHIGAATWCYPVIAVAPALVYFPPIVILVLSISGPVLCAVVVRNLSLKAFLFNLTLKVHACSASRSEPRDTGNFLSAYFPPFSPRRVSQRKKKKTKEGEVTF